MLVWMIFDMRQASRRQATTPHGERETTAAQECGGGERSARENCSPKAYQKVSASKNKPIATDSLRVSYGLSHWRFLNATKCKIEIAGR